MKKRDVLTLVRLKHRLRYDPDAGKWFWVNSSKSYLNGKEAGCLGTYDTPEEASEAYMARAKRFFGDFARQ